MPNLTEQQKNPHPQLVECRNIIEATVLEAGSARRQRAAEICSNLTNEQVELVLSSDGDAEKVQKAIEAATEVVDKVQPSIYRQRPKNKQKKKPAED